MQQQSMVTNTGGWISSTLKYNDIRAALIVFLLLMLSACGGSGGGDSVTKNSLPEPSSDGVTPTLLEATIKQSRAKDPKPTGTAELGQAVRVEILASEGLLKPVITINGLSVDVTGKVNSWSGERELNEADIDGPITFSVTFEDISGEVGTMVTETTDGSIVTYCAEGCPDAGATGLPGNWFLDGEGAASVGPSAGSSEWWASTAANGAGPAERACWFDDVFRFGDDGSFSNVMGAETWVEVWQGGTDACGAPVAPHDGSAAATYVYDEIAGTLTITGIGAHLGLSKAVNGEELSSPADAPESIIYTVLTFDGDSMTVAVEAAPGVFWTFRLARAPVSPLAGKWKLDGEGAASVGPAPESSEWWATTAANGSGPAERACWFDDVYEFSKDGSFTNVHGAETWVEVWQGGTDACGAPVAPHDSSNNAAFEYDEEASTLTLLGQGAYVGLSKAVNGQELALSADAPQTIVYQITILDGNSMTVTLEAAPGVWWTFRLKRVSNSPLAGNWQLAGEGAASVGPTAGSSEWWSTTAANGAGPAERACWFDDVFHFGGDESFQNFMGADTWVEAWQGGTDTCGAPVTPHDGATSGSFTYDETASTLTLYGTGSHLGLAKAVNGQELASSADAPASITYTVMTLDGNNMTVTVEAAAGVFWTFNLKKISAADLAGQWKLDGEGAASVGPAPESSEWWATTSANGAGPAERACWFDDVYEFDADGAFTNEFGTETWIEAWQGGTDACGAPVAPHDGSANAVFVYDETAGTATISGLGAHVGLAKVVNGAELAAPGDAPKAITYTVTTLDGDNMTVTLEAGPGVWWTFRLKRVSNSPLAGNWKLAGEGAASVGPTKGSAEWWSTTAANGAGPAERACWFDDVFHFGGDESFQNFMGAETWVEAWQGGTDACGEPVSPHDGATNGSFSYDETASMLTIFGTGSHLGLAKAVNGQELASPADAPASITYEVLTLDGSNMTVTVEAAAGVWWSFNLTKD
jgi:hypothetical protein